MKNLFYSVLFALTSFAANAQSAGDSVNGFSNRTALIAGALMALIVAAVIALVIYKRSQRKKASLAAAEPKTSF